LSFAWVQPGKIKMGRRRGSRADDENKNIFLQARGDERTGSFGPVVR
jgi:hypothetical protein